MFRSTPVSLLIASVVVLALVGCDEKDTGASGDTAPPAPSEECTTVVFDEGDSGTYVINNDGDDHVKHHWYMPEGVERMEAKANWEGEGWLMEMDVGIGWCPHSGTSYKDDSSDSGELIIEVWPSDVDDSWETFQAEDQWFLHLGDASMGAHEDGESLDYTVEVKICSTPAS